MVGLLLRDRPTIVTDASWGIGREITTRPTEAGEDVTIRSHSLDDVRPVVGGLTTAHDGRVISVECDVTDRDEVRSLVDTALDGFGEVKVLVNSVGGSDESANVAHCCGEGTFERMADLNLEGQFLLNKEVLPAMVAVGGGSTIHMGLVNGLFGISLSDYSEVKSGLLAMSRNIAAHYGQHGVRSNAISVGTIETASRHGEMENTEGRTGGSSTREGWFDQHSLSHFGTPCEVAGTSSFLASELSSFTTGENVILDGGLAMSLPTSLVNEVYGTGEVPSRRQPRQWWRN